jgi:metal-responsive CopG/Arc/MetJ family transcriptional regulator
MTEKKTDVLNMRLDASLAKELDRIAAWREMSVSEVARDLLQYGIRVERQLQATELTRLGYGSTRVNRNAEDVGVKIDADLRFFSRREMEEMEAERHEEMGF